MTDPSHPSESSDPAAPAFYSRPSLNVETYDVRAGADLAHVPGVAGDVEFFVRLADRLGGAVLELGCGTGRVTWPLAEAGHEVVGLDRSGAMLAQAERKRAGMPADAGARVRFVEGDMTAFDLGRRFRLVIAPFRAFMSLLEPAAQRSCLEAVRRHLEPDGRLVLDLFDPMLEFLVPGGGVPRPVRDAVEHPETGRTVTTEILERVNDTLDQRLVELWRFREVQADGTVVREELDRLELRWTFRWETRYLLELSGFEVEAEYGDFRGSPPTYGREQVWVARPATRG